MFALWLAASIPGWEKFHRAISSSSVLGSAEKASALVSRPSDESSCLVCESSSQSVEDCDWFVWSVCTALDVVEAGVEMLSLTFEAMRWSTEVRRWETARHGDSCQYWTARSRILTLHRVYPT